MQQLLGTEYEAFEAALLTEPQVSIRLNRAKIASAQPTYRPVPWCSDGYYLDNRPAFTFDPRLHAGAYYVQEASSMFLAHVLQSCFDTPIRYLDLCAAPGGKSTLALSTLPRGSMVVCNEYVRTRAHILAENISKWGNPYTIVTNNSAADIGALRHYFDAILVDAPCSGEGMFRKDAQAIAEWTPAQVNLCADRQREILADVWEALRPGGLLIYSTCTYNIEENEAMLQFLQREFGAEPVTIDTPVEWHIHPSLTDTPAARFMPHYTRGEGLFMAVMRKSGDNDECERDQLLARNDKRKKSSGKSRKESTVKIPSEVKSWILAPEKYTFDADEAQITAVPAEYTADQALLTSRLDVVHRGIPLATPKGRDWQPHHALALSTALRREAFDALPLSLDEAIAYLRREALSALPDSRRGMRLITYDNLPIGWGNHLGNRLNNLYPQEWRIRSGYRPEEWNMPEW